MSHCLLTQAVADRFAGNQGRPRAVGAPVAGTGRPLTREQTMRVEYRTTRSPGRAAAAAAAIGPGATLQSDLGADQS